VLGRQQLFVDNLSREQVGGVVDSRFRGLPRLRDRRGEKFVVAVGFRGLQGGTERPVEAGVSD